MNHFSDSPLTSKHEERQGRRMMDNYVLVYDWYKKM